MEKLENLSQHVCSKTFQIISIMSRKSFNRIITSAFLVCSAFTLSAQELVIRIDDMGSSHSANVACIDTYVNGIAKSVEIMPVCAWFPEAVRMLDDNPGLDVGVHLTLTSEWENVKWRPLTHCPSLTDSDGYFYPMMAPNSSYPGQSVIENNGTLNLKEIENEFRAQIELALKYIPQVTHLTGHMGATGFSEEVLAIVQKLSQEYGLPSIDRAGASEEYGFTYVGYDGPSRTFEEKLVSFKSMLGKLEKGKRYLFLDHPAYDDAEMSSVFHIGYEHVASDRQGVTDLLKNPEVKELIDELGIKLIDINYLTKKLPRAEASKKFEKAAQKYLDAVAEAGQDLHSIMVVKDGNVIFEKWLGEGREDVPHVLNSVSKTFTSAAVGLAISEGMLKIDDKVISFFPDKLPETISENLAAMTVRDLLTMTCGQENDAFDINADVKDWEKAFFAHPVTHKPGTLFAYNSVGTYMLSAIVQKVSGQKLTDFLYPRLFRPLGINNVRWIESPSGVNTGGWGLYLKTEDLAKMGQLLLQGGKWNGKQVLPADWVKEMSSKQVECIHAGLTCDMSPKDEKQASQSDWLQGYGYQMWRCRHNAFRADGAAGQYIIVIPEKNTAIAMTALIHDMQGEINLIWKHILPAL